MFRLTSALLLAFHSAGHAQVGAFAAEGAGPAPVERFGPNRIAVAIDTRAVRTNNAGPDDETGLVHSDTVLEVQPSVVFARHAPRLTLTGNLAVSAIAYADGSHKSRLLPRGRVDLSSKVIEELVFFDASARVDPTVEDPYASRPGDPTSYKLQPRTSYALSPYVSRRFGDLGSLRIRSDYSATRITDPTTKLKSTADAIDNTALFEHLPKPLGYSLEGWSRSESDDRAEQAVLKEDGYRARLDFAVNPQVILGISGGAEGTAFGNAKLYSNRYGGRVRLRPTERTDLTASIEKRYFGNGWDLNFTHRSPFLNVTVQANRTVSSQDTPQFAFAAGENISNSLNQSLLTRFPDPVARQREVDSIISTLNVPQIAPGALTFYSLVPQIRQGVLVNVSLRGRRNFVFAQYGGLKVTALPMLDQAGLGQSEDGFQQSVLLGWSLRATPLFTFNTTAEWVRTTSTAGAQSGQYTEQRFLKGEAVASLSPRAAITFGVRKLRVRATRALDPNDLLGETAAYVGLRQRF